jgi:hypothetical protein
LATRILDPTPGQIGQHSKINALCILALPWRGVRKSISMTIARQVLPKKTYHIVRQTNEWMFMLKPSQVALEIVAYCIFEAALKYGVLLHGFGLMSNHLHMQVTDQLSKLPLFTKRSSRKSPRP